jgi:hypothetical protein
MPPTPAAPRLRLAVHMERRRKELNLRWQDVSDAAGVSVRALQAVRTGGGELRPLTEAGIERGLQWRPGSIQRIYAGNDPIDLTGHASPESRAPEPAGADEQWQPPLSPGGLAATRPFADAIYAQLLDLAARGITNPAGNQVFPDSPTDASDWDNRAAVFSVQERVWMIAEAQRRQHAADERQAGAGLVQPALDRS